MDVHSRYTSLDPEPCDPRTLAFLALSSIRPAASLDAVVKQSVLLPLQIRKNILRTQFLDPTAKLLPIPTPLQSQKIRTNTSNMRASHRSTSNRIHRSSRSNPRRSNINPRSQHINKRSEIREITSAIISICSANGADLWDAGGREEVGIDVGIAGGDSDEDTSIGKSCRGFVEESSVALATVGAEGHGDYGAANAAFGADVVGDPVHASDEVGERAAACAVYDFDVDDGGALCDAVGASCCCAGAVGSVAVHVAVGFVGDGGEAEGGAAAEVYVVEVDALKDCCQ